MDTHASEIFSTFGSGFVSWICPEQGHVFDSFLIHVAHRCREKCTVKTCTFNIDLFRSRARSKGIGFTSLFLYVTSRYPLAVFVPPICRFSSRVAYFVVLRRYANLRFEKLIASTCPCCVPPPRASSRLAQESMQTDRWTLNARMRLSYDDECATLRERVTCEIRLCEDFPGWAQQRFFSLESECEVSVNDRKLKNAFCILTWPTNVTNVLPRLNPTHTDICSRLSASSINSTVNSTAYADYVNSICSFDGVACMNKVRATMMRVNI